MAYREYDVSSRSEGLRNAALLAWICYAVGLLSSWLTGPIGFVVALVKRGDSVGTVYESHFNAVIRSGIICFIGYTLGWITVWIGIGFVILFAVWLYNVYVVIRGFMRLMERRPYD